MNKEKDLKPIWVYIIVYFGIQFLAGMIIGIIYPQNVLDKTTELAGIITLASALLTFIVLYILYHTKLKEKLVKITKKDIIIILVGTVILIAANELISNLLVKANVEMQNQELIMESFKYNRVVMILAVVIFAPIVEEMVFRYSFSTFIKNDIAFVIISSLVFGLMHSAGLAIIVYFILGVFLSLIYLKTNRNVIASSIAHILNNLFAVITMMIMFK
jgi:membrane protease YdiL (CAAX protease family)